MSFTNAVDLLAIATKRREAVVDVPEWGAGATLKVRGMSAGEAIAWMKVAKDEPERELVYAMAVGALQADGQQMFSLSQMDELAKVDWKPLARIANKVFELSGLGGIDEKNG